MDDSFANAADIAIRPDGVHREFGGKPVKRQLSGAARETTRCSQHLSAMRRRVIEASHSYKDPLGQERLRSVRFFSEHRRYRSNLSHASNQMVDPPIH